MCNLYHAANWQHISRTCLCGLSIVVGLGACASVEFVPQKKHYEIAAERDLWEDEHFQQYALTTSKTDPEVYGTFFIDRSNSGDDSIAVEVRKEKSFGPSRYEAKARFFNSEDRQTSFSLSFDRKRDLWVGIDKSYQVDFNKWFD